METEELIWAVGMVSAIPLEAWADDGSDPEVKLLERSVNAVRHE